ncbi:MAG: hypothetical protein OEZ08_13315 [Betaproteobacteria bacterium]|nr:hypothetical protein [Betaproteobacteria bacterium]
MLRQIFSVTGIAHRVIPRTKSPSGGIEIANTFQRARASMSVSQILQSDIPAKIGLSIDPGKDFDPYGIFDPALHRFKPVDAGYYQVNVRPSWAVALGNGSRLAVYKNGVEHVAYACYAVNAPIFVLSDLIFLNGTTDYLEMWAFHMFGTDLAASAGLIGTHMSIVGPF